MKVSVPLTNGFLPDKYAKYAPNDAKENGQPIVSFPVHFSDVPSNTRSLALIMIDHDSIPVCGFTWIHWVVANIPTNMADLPEDASRNLKDQLVQGKNSLASQFVNGQPNTGYTGPTPPDKDHDYTLVAYALDEMLPLKQGFWLNEFLHASEGHVLTKQKIIVPSRA